MCANGFSRVASAAVCLVAGALLAVCESSGRTAAGEKAVESLASTRSDVNKARGVVGNVQVALNQLNATANGGNVWSAYKNFTKAEDNLRDVARHAKEQATEMRENGRAYVENWEKEMDQVSSPEIRSSATERRAAVRANYDQISASARAARDAYQAYEKDLADIRHALANDLTPAGVRSAQGVIAQARQHGQVLQQRLDTLSGEIDRVYAGLGGKVSQ